MPIDAPQATQFVANYSRPIAEAMINLRARLNEAADEWVASGVQPFFTGINLGETVQDQNVDGHPVTGQDIVDWALMVSAIKTVFDTPNDMEPIQRLAVRALSISE